MSEHGGNEEGSNACTHFHFSNPVRWSIKNRERSEGRRLVKNGSGRIGLPCFAPFRFRLKPVVAVSKPTPHWNPKADPVCLESAVNRECSSAKTTKAEREASKQSLFEAVEDKHQDGHTKDRTNMLPLDSCGPDCPVCAHCER